jgi:2-C-methyl-D-erythritol 4-phosphate cytidylyltransferase
MVTALIVAAGKGTRMGPLVDKLFLEINGRPVIAHTWQRFENTSSVQEIVVVVRDGMQRSFEELAGKYKFNKPFQLVTGGPQRQDSVWNGLEALSPGTDIVAIQDGARPCTTPKLITATIEAARESGASVAARLMTDTVKESLDGKFINRTLDRSQLWAVQTPQTFRVEIIVRALTEVRKRGLLVTDDTAACELIGQPVRLITGIEPNPKVTHPDDLEMINLILRRESQPAVP